MFLQQATELCLREFAVGMLIFEAFHHSKSPESIEWTSGCSMYFIGAMADMWMNRKLII